MSQRLGYFPFQQSLTRSLRPLYWHICADWLEDHVSLELGTALHLETALGETSPEMPRLVELLLYQEEWYLQHGEDILPAAIPQYQDRYRWWWPPGHLVGKLAGLAGSKRRSPRMSRASSRPMPFAGRGGRAELARRLEQFRSRELRVEWSRRDVLPLRELAGCPELTSFHRLTVLEAEAAAATRQRPSASCDELFEWLRPWLETGEWHGLRLAVPPQRDRLALLEALPLPPTLQELGVEEWPSYIGRGGLPSDPPPLPERWRQLRQLHLTVGPRELAALAALQEFPQLEALELHCPSPIPPEQWRAFCQCRCPRLAWLRLRGELRLLQPADWAWLRWPQLRVLEVSHAHDALLLGLLDGPVLDQLHLLWLNASQVSVSCLARFLSSPRLAALRLLHLDDLPARPSVLRAIAANPVLRELQGLGFGRSAACGHLPPPPAAAVAGDCFLHHLDMPHLRYLSLHHLPYTPRGRRSLDRNPAFAHLRILIEGTLYADSPLRPRPHRLPGLLLHVPPQSPLAAATADRQPL